MILGSEEVRKSGSEEVEVTDLQEARRCALPNPTRRAPQLAIVHRHHDLTRVASGLKSHINILVTIHAGLHDRVQLGDESRHLVGRTASPLKHIRRHLADLTMSEVARALRALSSCYVERRAKLAEGGALSSAGKRAAFALFYGPQHFLITQAILDALPPATENITNVVDLGCGTGSAGAAWALAAASPSMFR